MDELLSFKNLTMRSTASAQSDDEGSQPNTATTSQNTTPGATPIGTPAQQRKGNTVMKLNIQDSTWHVDKKVRKRAKHQHQPVPRQPPDANDGSANRSGNGSAQKGKSTTSKANYLRSLPEKLRNPDVRFRVVLALLMASILSIVFLTHHLHRALEDSKHIRMGIKLEERDLYIHHNWKGMLLHGKLANSLSTALMAHNCKIARPGFCKEWKFRARLEIYLDYRESNVTCYNVQWRKMAHSDMEDTYNLRNAEWYGMGEVQNIYWPSRDFHVDYIKFDTGNDPLGAIIKPYWLSSKGVGILVHKKEHDEVLISFNSTGDNQLLLYTTNEILNYTICKGETALDVHMTFFPQLSSTAGKAANDTPSADHNTTPSSAPPTPPPTQPPAPPSSPPPPPPPPTVTTIAHNVSGGGHTLAPSTATGTAASTAPATAAAATATVGGTGSNNASAALQHDAPFAAPIGPAAAGAVTATTVTTAAAAAATATAGVTSTVSAGTISDAAATNATAAATAGAASTTATGAATATTATATSAASVATTVTTGSDGGSTGTTSDDGSGVTSSSSGRDQGSLLEGNSTATSLFLSKAILAPQVDRVDEFNQSMVLAFAEKFKSDQGIIQGHFVVLKYWWQRSSGDLDFDADRFPKPAEMVRQLHEGDMRVMLEVDPYVCLNSSSFDQVSRGEVLIHDENLVPLFTRWKGQLCSIIDIYNTNEAVPWFISKLTALMKSYGIDGFVFQGGQSSTLPYHYVNNKDRSYLSQYLDVVKSVSEYIGSPGGPRGYVTLGRQEPTWEALRSLPAKVLMIGLFGHNLINPGCVGGDLMTLENGQRGLADTELYVRWWQFAVFMPVFQVCRVPNEAIAEFEVVKIIRKLVNLREKKIIKAIARSLEEEPNFPVVRPLWALDPRNENCYRFPNQFAVGNDMIVAPIVEPGVNETEVYLPFGTWCEDQRVHTGETTVVAQAELDTVIYFFRCNKTSLVV